MNRKPPPRRPRPPLKRRPPQKDTAWHAIGDWYNSIVGKHGHYYHQHVVLPGVRRLLPLKKGDSLLDLACGQGVLAREVADGVEYWGVDAAGSLIDQAKSQNKNREFRFLKFDVSQPLQIAKKDFAYCTVILALQNIQNTMGVIKNAADHLKKNGQVLLVLNHPCFRIPRQSSWGIDETNKMQYRRINRYMEPLEVPLQVNPSQGESSEQMWSFHQPLSEYFRCLSACGFATLKVEEWISDKSSVGSAAKMENRARKEFPLFLAILAQKLS